MQDNESRYYNRYRNQAAGRLPLVAAGERPERLGAADRLPPAVRVAVVTDFNLEQVRHRGAGIFLHVNGARRDRRLRERAAASFMRKLMRGLDPDRVPVIAVGR